jgi:hypothetical protein
MNILPGLRELRAPLAAGYMWLITAWLWLDHFGLVPESRPVDDGWLARLWIIGDALGAATLLAILTFVAYLIGSFLEIDVDNPILNRVVPFVVRRRAQYKIIPTEQQLDDDEQRRRWEEIDRVLEGVSEHDLKEIHGVQADPVNARFVSLQVANSFSRLARQALYDALVTGEGVPRPPTEDSLMRLPPGELWAPDGSYFYSETFGLFNYRVDLILREVIIETPQLASRLLVKNKELYGRYDRFRSEASFRINVSLALLALLVTATFLAHLYWLVKLALILVELAAAILLFRQGLLRSISARDVIAQAIVIGEIESAYVRRKERLESATGGAAQAESSDGETRPDAQATTEGD